MESRREPGGDVDSASESIFQTLTARLDPANQGTVTVDIEYRFPSSLTGFTVVVPPRLSLSTTDGFQADDEQCTWDGHTSPATLKGSLTASKNSSGAYRYVDAGNWAIVQRPPLSVSYKYRGSEPTLERRYEVKGDGVASSDGCVMYLGPHEAYVEHAADQEFNLIVPAAATLRESPRNILATLGDAAARLEVGARNQSVVAIVAPTGIGWSSLGVQSGTNGFWAQDSCTLESTNNTWIHEYVHTRQEWEYSAATKWLTEATTEYYAALFTYHQGRVSFPEFYHHITTSRDSGSVLVDPKHWTSSRAYYTKGRRVLAALDVEIRDRTAGEATFQDVFRELNGHTGSLTHSAFLDALETATGRGFESWLDEYVCGPATPTIPNDETIFQPDVERTSEPDTESGPGPVPGPEPGEPPEPDSGDLPCPVCETDVSRSEQYCPSCGHALHVQCPVCGTDVAGELYCPECGSDLEEDCPLCGAPRVGDEPYCHRCGTEFQ